MNSKRFLLVFLLFMLMIFLILAVVILYLSVDFEKNFIVRDIDSFEVFGNGSRGADLINESFNLEYGDLTNALLVEDFLEINVSVYQGFVMMKSVEDQCEAIVVAIDNVQAHSIYQGLNEQISFRPTTHDIIYDIVENFDIEVLMTKITSFDGTAYYGNIILKQDNKILNLDIRPSDGIAIAVRTNSSIYISKDVMNRLKERVC